VRGNVFLFDEPSQVLRRSVGAVGGQRRRPHAEARLGPLQHCTRCSDFRLANGAGSLAIDDHAMIGVDQVVIGIGEKGVSLVCACPLRRRIGSRDELRRCRRGGAERRVVETSQVFLRGAGRGFLDSSGFHSRFGTDRCLLASAAIKLASTANPSALTKPSAMQRRTTLSKRRRSASLWRKRPCLFFENVE
jgi:hypothetical protein